MNLSMILQMEMSNTQYSRIITLWWQMTRWLFRGWSVPGASPQLRLRHHPHIRRVIAKRWWWDYVIWWCLVVIWGSIRWHGWCFSCYLGAVWNSWNLPSAGDSEVFIVFQGCASNAAQYSIHTCTQKTPSRIFLCAREWKNVRRVSTDLW